MKPPKYLHSNDGLIDAVAVGIAVAVIFIFIAIINRVHAAEAPVIMDMSIPGHPEINSQAAFERLPLAIDRRSLPNIWINSQLTAIKAGEQDIPIAFVSGLNAGDQGRAMRLTMDFIRGEGGLTVAEIPACRGGSSGAFVLYTVKSHVNLALWLIANGYVDVPSNYLEFQVPEALMTGRDQAMAQRRGLWADPNAMRVRHGLPQPARCIPSIPR
jgi:hypothetical protein